MPKDKAPPTKPAQAPEPIIEECPYPAMICGCAKKHLVDDDPAARYRKRLEGRAPAVLAQLEALTRPKR